MIYKPSHKHPLPTISSIMKVTLKLKISVVAKRGLCLTKNNQQFDSMIVFCCLTFPSISNFQKSNVRIHACIFREVVFTVLNLNTNIYAYTTLLLH
jgi:hypothetical protein